MTAKRVPKRIEIIDIAKCIAIFMVVLGHTAPDSELLGDPATVYKVLYSFHMPLLFFLSGLSSSTRPLKDRTEWRSFLRKNILILGIPYLVWGLIYCRFSFQALGYVLYGSRQALVKAETVTSLWYLSCLFSAKVIAQAVIGVLNRLGLTEKRAYYLIPAILLMCLGGVLPSPEIGYPWCLNVACVAAGCILIGIAARRLMTILSARRGPVLIGLFVISVCIYILAVLSAGEGFVLVAMGRNYYGNPVNAVLFAVFGGMAVMLLSILLKRLADEWLTGISMALPAYLGQHTLGIFLIHKPILQTLLVPFFLRIFGESHLVFARIIAALAVMPVSIWLTRLIEYYIPELVGTYRREKPRGIEKCQ